MYLKMNAGFDRPHSYQAEEGQYRTASGNIAEINKFQRRILKGIMSYDFEHVWKRIKQ